MTIHDLCERFNVGPRTIHKYMEDKGMPRPIGYGRWATYDRRHVEWIEAYNALKHNNVYPAQAIAFCRESGISLRQYVLLKEQSIRDHGLGIA